MQTKQKAIVVMKSTLRRLPKYYAYLTQRCGTNAFISSAKLADDLALNPILVRKDLASVSTLPGKPKVGFNVAQLVEDIGDLLGYRNYDEALLVGVGSLGRALLSYDYFKDYGIEISVAFDSNEVLVGIKINNKLILPMEKLEDLVRRMNVKVGIVTVPADKAQMVADQLVRAGIQAIWNFAPTILDVPDGVVVRNENLASSLSALIYKLKSNSI